MASQEKINSMLQTLKEILEDKSNTTELKYLDFKGDGKGLIWSNDGYTKQFVYQTNPDRFFVSETIDLGKGKGLSINGIDILNEKELGGTVTKSSLKEVGRLKGLIVDGGFSVNSYLFYNASVDRLGLGTENPNAAFSICDEGTEIILGSKDYNNAAIGTFNSSDLELVTDNTSRIKIGAGGNIELGNTNNGPIKVLVHGSLGVNVNSPDPRTALHVNGAIKFNDKIHLSGTEPPRGGAHNQGDILWNSDPIIGRYVGWVCIKAGNPGEWRPFGEIK